MYKKLNLASNYELLKLTSANLFYLPLHCHEHLLAHTYTNLIHISKTRVYAVMALECLFFLTEVSSLIPLARYIYRLPVCDQYQA